MDAAASLDPNRPTDALARGLDWLSRHSRRVVAVACASILVGGLIYSLVLGDAIRYADESDYLALASSIASGRGFSFDGAHPTAFRPPGYSAVLSIPMAAGAPIWFLRWLNFVALAATAWLSQRIAERHFGRLAGVATALMVVAYPVLFYAAGTFFPQTVGTVGLLLVIELFWRANVRPAAAATAGALMGAVVLTVAGLPAHVLPMAACGALVQTQQRRRAALVFFAAFTVVTLAWTERNFQVFDRFVLVSSNVGLNLLLGNSPNTSPTSGRDVVIWMYEAQAERLDEAARDTFYLNQALTWVNENPVAAAQLYGLKLLNHFNFRNDLVTESESGVVQDAVMFATYYGLLALVAVRLVWTARGRPLTRFEVAMLLMYLAHAALTAVFFTRIRHRLPFDYLLIVFAAGALSGLLTRPLRAPRPESAAPAPA